MSGYKCFSSFYDELTANVDYKKLGKYYNELVREFSNGGNLIVDLACGTASLSFELVGYGYDVISIDSSEQMLSVARNKADNINNPLFLCQKMQDIDLFGTVDAVICSLDSINHLENKKDVCKTFEKVSLFLNKNGIFVFDVNSLYKHQCILADNTFVYETESVFCTWQNSFCSKDNSVKISLDFFSKSDKNNYRRFSEEFFEYYYDDDFISDSLKKTGFEIIDVFDDFTRNAVKDITQRKVFLCRKVI